MFPQCFSWEGFQSSQSCRLRAENKFSWPYFIDDLEPLFSRCCRAVVATPLPLSMGIKTLAGYQLTWLTQSARFQMLAIDWARGYGRRESIGHRQGLHRQLLSVFRALFQTGGGWSPRPIMLNGIIIIPSNPNPFNSVSERPKSPEDSGTRQRIIRVELATTMKTLPPAESSRRPQDALVDSAKLWAKRISWRLASLRFWLVTRRRILWFELCTAAPRMTIARNAIHGLPKDVHDPRDLGPLFESGSGPGGFVPCSRTDARSQDVEQLQTTYPWATEADQWMFLLGWERGEAYAYDNPRKREKAALTSAPR